LCTAGAVLLAIGLWPKPQALYRVTVLPSLGGGFTSPDAINDQGVIVGCATVAGGDRRCFLWDHQNGMQDLGPIDGRADINNKGQIAGTMVDPNGERRAFVWTPGGGRRLLGTLNGRTTVAMAINNRGQVVGESWTAADTNHAFLWEEVKGMRDLNPPGTIRSHAYAINDRGQVMVFSPQLSVSVWDPDEGVHYRKSQMPGGGFGWINSKGRAVFAQRRPPGNSCIMSSEAESDWATLRESQGSITDVRLNDVGQVLFTESRSSRIRFLNQLSATGRTTSYLLDPNRGPILLDRLVPRERGESFVVQDLNNRGDIVGVLISGYNECRGVLLEPIPERWAKQTPQ
jgi:probable HAF family extracellular repeat protein